MALAVFASAGLIPRVLEPGRIELLLSKPVSRTHILLGRFAGNVLVVAGNITYLILGVWLIVGEKTGIWRVEFLLAIGTTVFTFAVLLTVVVLLGVLVESTALATMVTMGLMILSPILAQTQLMMRLLSSESSRAIWRLLYYALPKVYDVGSMTLNLARRMPIESWMPVWSSALFAVVILSAALAIFGVCRFAQKRKQQDERNRGRDSGDPIERPGTHSRQHRAGGDVRDGQSDGRERLEPCDSPAPNGIGGSALDHAVLSHDGKPVTDAEGQQRGQHQWEHRAEADTQCGNPDPAATDGVSTAGPALRQRKRDRDGTVQNAADAGAQDAAPHPASAAPQGCARDPAPVPALGDRALPQRQRSLALPA
jgi:hypothetical protein